MTDSVAVLRGSSEELFRELAASIPTALWVRDVERQTIRYVNPAWEKLTGLAVLPGDAIDVAYQAIHPDDLQWVIHERRKTLGVPASSEYRVVKPDGGLHWVQGRTFPIPDPSGQSPLLVEILDDITQRREAQRQLLHLARHDALTDLPNRTVLYEALHDALTHADRDGHVVSVLLLDIDEFKGINDTLGHTMGDALLREFAGRLTACVRPEDTVGRLGGDEFAIVVSAPANAYGGLEVANRIHEALRAPFLLESREISMTTSIGIARYPADTTDLETLVRYADAAMYEVKAAGRNAFRSYSTEMRTRAQKKSDIAGALRLAQNRGEFALHYQPKMQIASGAWTSVEGLIRWDRPGHGLVLPGLFIPTLEEVGLMVPVGAWVIDMACRQIRKWALSGLSSIHVAVNVSSRQVRDETFVSDVADLIRAHRIDPSLLEFEVTEGLLMAHGEAVSVALRKLKDIGISIAIDNFGTGFSNLASLRRFPIDALKMDGSLIRAVTANPEDAAVAAAIINMAHALRLNVIAEGVESPEQLEFLRAHGCDEAQGHLLSKALPAEQISACLRQAHSAQGSGLRTLQRSVANA